MAASPAPRPWHASEGRADDLDEVMAVMAGAFDPAFGEGWSRSQCAGILPMPGVALSVVRDRAGRVRGFALARTIAGESELLLLAVDPGWQGQGIGQALLDRFIAHGHAERLARLHLEVRESNPAVDFYRDAGFAMVGRRVQYYRGNDGVRRDAITMAIDLPE